MLVSRALFTQLNIQALNEGVSKFQVQDSFMHTQIPSSLHCFGVALVKFQKKSLLLFQTLALSLFEF